MPHAIKFHCHNCKVRKVVSIRQWKGKQYKCECGAVYMLWQSSEDRKWRWQTLIMPIYKKLPKKEAEK